MCVCGGGGGGGAEVVICPLHDLCVKVTNACWGSRTLKCFKLCDIYMSWLLTACDSFCH